MAGILAALEGGPLDVWTLAARCRASPDSTRRALRKLRRSGQVACLGYGMHGKHLGLPEDVAARLEVWPAQRQAHMAAVMGPRFTRFFLRTLVTAL